ncbi:MAG: ATP-dependent helicase, partial [Thermoplasmata archaeon]|nr:ATP-dependent helicase [Thermoplasmata archaeon]
PHILITTPESIAIILSTPKFSQKLEGLEYLIIDEIHEVCNNKRGSMLALNMERLEARTGGFTRLGLSATQAPIEEIASFLSGYEGEETRPMGIVEAKTRKELDIEVVCPVEDMTALPFEVVNDRMYDLVGELIKEHKTTIVFTNTRAGTESVSYRLQERGIERIAAHHGSLSKETRLEVEEELKLGLLRGVVSSTSLELGIDIGSIDLVCQIGSPKSIAKGLQRIGRAGHSVGAVPTGRFIVFESDDLVECAVLARKAKEGHIDRVSIPRNSLDILAQILVGMSLEHRWEVGEAYKMVRQAQPFHELTEQSFFSVLEYLGARDSDYVYSKLWYDKEEQEFGRKKGARMIYYLNLGAIPDESNYVVYAKGGRRLGKLSEKFVERLTSGDIFVLGGQSYKYMRTRGMKVFVEDSPGRKPTVPSWSGEMLPRSYDLSTAIGGFRRLFGEKIARGEKDKELLAHLHKYYHADEGSANSILSYMREQQEFDPRLPTDKRLVIEGYVDMRGRHNLIFHACHGRRVNDALSRAYAMAISNRYNCNVSLSLTDDNFMLTLPRKIEAEDVTALVTSKNLEELLRSAVKGTEMFKQRFRHCSTRSFMVLRNYKGRGIGVGRQQSRSERIMKVLLEEEDHPVVWETYNEILNQAMDLGHAREVLEAMESGEREVVCLPYGEVPSPFAHNVVLAGISDIVLMEDRSTLLRELHRKVL